MGLQNSPIGSQSWLSSLLSWIRQTVKHHDLLEVKSVEYDNNSIPDKHVSSLIYKRSVDHISDDSRHLTDRLTGTSNYVGTITSSTGLITATASGSTVDINSGLIIGTGVKLTGNTLSLDVSSGNGLAITAGNPTSFATNFIGGNGVSITGTSQRSVHAHHFAVTKQIVSTAADTPVVFIQDSEVPSGMKVIILGFFGYVWGATDWTAGGLVLNHISIQDTNLNEFVRFPLTELLGNTIINPTSLATSDFETRLVAGTGGDTGYGIQVVGHNSSHANVAAGSGSDLWLTIYGVIR